MRILGLDFQQRAIFENNHNKAYSQYRSALNFQPSSDIFVRSENPNSRAISFTAKQEQISREPLVKLYKEHLNCLCCGREMIDPKVIKEMQEEHVFNCPTADAIKILDKYEKNMHTVEKGVFNLLKQEAEKHPERSIKEHIIELKKTHELPLIRKQVGIFKLIDKYAEKIKPELHSEIREFLLDSFDTIKQGDNNFSRIRFINNLTKILENYPNTANKENLIRLAGNLPTAYDDIDAFIVKYANPKYKSENIALRLLTYSMATIEHIHPQDSKDVKGANHLHNYVPECMRCNSFRSNKPMVYQLEDYPEMFINAQKLFDRLIDFANNGKLSKMYIIKLYKALRHESEGVLELDYSRLKLNKSLKEELKKPFTYPVNPDKKESDYIPEPLPDPTVLPISWREDTIPEILDGISRNLPEPEVIEQVTDNTPTTKQEISNITPIISRKKRKRMVAEGNNPILKLKREQKSKKIKSENKDTVKRTQSRK